MKKLLKPTQIKRILFFLTLDVIFIILSLYVSFLFRFDLVFPHYYTKLFYRLIFLFLIVKIPVFWFFKLYNITWKYVGLYDFFNIVKASFLSTTTIGIIIYFLKHPYFENTPRSVIVIDFFISLFLISLIRISKRFFTEFIYRPKNHKKGKPAIIIGAGNTGEMVVRDLTRGDSPYNPIGFLDDDRSILGLKIHGIPILGTTGDIPHIVSLYKIETAIIAIPSIGKDRLRDLYMILKESGIKDIKIIPRLYQTKETPFLAKNLEDIKIEDLLGRQEVKVDIPSIERFLKDKKILITGAAGSIGKEIAKQVTSYKPKNLILYEIDETRLFELENSLKEYYPSQKDSILAIIGDIRDREKLDEVFAKHRPDIVFHAAAYKHVPLMERWPDEAVKTNILGTYNLAEVSVRYGVEKFILISTDKAVKPKSVMGWSKNMAEKVIQTFGREGETDFVAVRFGNVLGSRGSVLPIFLKQIEKGGPITVTDARMKRYFMTIPEAVALVLEGAVIGKNGQILILDMGEPVSILDLARELIKLHGLTPYKDIDIEITGIRPGEKLFEELTKDTENLETTSHKRIFSVKSREIFTKDEIDRLLKDKDILKDMSRWQD